MGMVTQVIMTTLYALDRANPNIHKSRRFFACQQQKIARDISCLIT